MLRMESDYLEGAHEAILQRLMETNREKTSGYGSDDYCESAKEKIRKACRRSDADVFFLTGGTQTNQTIISSLLKPYQGVVAAETGHINVHEAGAIEATGHKVLALPHKLGKISAQDLEMYMKSFYNEGSYDHMVFPGMVYISHPTELGTLYGKKELEEIYRVCKEYHLILFIDGARLGYGLMSPETDVTLPDIAACCDVFYIGGTKVGAFCGEAVVFSGRKQPEHFLTLVKQRSALLAKGRFLGLQFDTLFTDDLYFKISKHAMDMAGKLQEILRKKGYELAWDSPTNQQFFYLSEKKYVTLSKELGMSLWEHTGDGRVIVRLTTSWATTQENLEELENIL